DRRDRAELGRGVPARERRGPRASGARQVLYVFVPAGYGGARHPGGHERGEGGGDPGGSRSPGPWVPVYSPCERRDLAQLRQGDAPADVSRHLVCLLPAGHEAGGGPPGPDAEPARGNPSDRAVAEDRRTCL
ncbi:MAG: hypothetical protein AVDCRST_MAG25-2434, partial [uncultured Rubrobacteraceae bacterium]